MTREQYVEALEAGCSVHVNGYAVEPMTIYRVRVDKPGMPWTRWNSIEEALDDLDERQSAS